jgi:putative FmdB family regulatory protein
MPIYEYQCNRCHHKFDVLQKISEGPVNVCPQCSGSEVVRLVSAAGFQLKGTGWYATDFKDKGKPEKKPTESTTSETGKTSTEAAKPAEIASNSTKNKGDSD